MYVTLTEYSESRSNFIERIFVFFMILFLKKIETLSASKPQCDSRRPKPILKILPIYRKDILEKQLSQVICPKYVFRLLNASEFRKFLTKLNMMVKVVGFLS